MNEMTAMQRVLTALSGREPDRVPFFLLPTMHGARQLGMGIREYFSRAENVVEGQLRMRARYGHDCLYPFFHAPLEVEAFGGEVIYVEDGPPNSGAPLVRSPEEILDLTPPRIQDTPCLQKVLTAISGLKHHAGDTVPIIGVAVSPFSLPVMQLGFERYLEIMHEREDLFRHLMRVNEAFCVQWANAQLQAGATAICYFDPVSSPTIIPIEKYEQSGFRVACRTIAAINGPTATHFASGRALGLAELLPETGTAIVGVGMDEDLADLKRAYGGKLSLIGNLNGITMRHWDRAECRRQVHRAIAAAAPGGGFILSDSHGEIPWQVPEQVLQDISEAVQELGRYPLSPTLGDV
jgi:uroporphyrinogen decarboxylase